MLTLRGFQEDIITETRQLLRAGEKRILIQCPTGAGKTVLAAHMLRTIKSKGHRAWFVVHRRELVRQSVDTLTNAAGIEVGVVAAGFTGNRHQPIQVCMIGTLRNRRRVLEDPKVILLDECHHVAAATWSAIFGAYPDAVHIGLTATPERLDGTGLRKWFHHIVKGPTVHQLIEEGYLSDYRMFAPSVVDLAGVHTVRGDFNRRELDEAMQRSQVVGDVFSHYTKHCDGKSMVVFAWSISASEAIAKGFRDLGVAAEHIDGKTHSIQRDSAMDRFRAGQTKILCNVDLFGEGVDVPGIEAIALLRPTKSLSMYMQQIGRGLRPLAGKERLIVLDHAGNSDRFGLPDDDREWSLDGTRKDPKKKDDKPVKRCPMCFAVLNIQARVCKHCGHAIPVQEREIAQVEGELTEVANERERARVERSREQGMAKTVEDLTEIGMRRGYKNPAAWAKHVYSGRMARGLANEARRMMEA